MSDQSEQQEQPPSPNRWYTTVSVEIYINERMRYIKWFSDLQMAYLWVKDHIHTLNEPFNMENNFVHFADRMDQRWRDRQDGCTLASNARYKYRVYYEPDVPFRHEDQDSRRVDEQEQEPQRIQNNPQFRVTVQLQRQILQYQNNRIQSQQPQPQQPFVFHPMNHEDTNIPPQTPTNT